MNDWDIVLHEFALPSLLLFVIWLLLVFYLFGRRNPGPAARLTLCFRLPNGGTTMSLRINNDSPGAAASVKATDKEGVTAKIFGAPVWKSDNEAVATVTAADDGLTALVKPVADGTCNISVSLEGDETPGVDTVTTTALVEVVEPEATQATITFGEPQ